MDANNSSNNNNNKRMHSRIPLWFRGEQGPKWSVRRDPAAFVWILLGFSLVLLPIVLSWSCCDNIISCFLLPLLSRFGSRILYVSLVRETLLREKGKMKFMFPEISGQNHMVWIQFCAWFSLFFGSELSGQLNSVPFFPFSIHFFRKHQNHRKRNR